MRSEQDKPALYHLSDAELVDLAAGGDTAGGLGVDCEFFESVLVPQVMLNGLMGFALTADGFRLDPRLPSDWPELTLDRIQFHDLILRVKVTRHSIEVRKEGITGEPCFVHLPTGGWKTVYLKPDGGTRPVTLRKRSDGAVETDWSDAVGVRFERRALRPSPPPSREADPLPSDPVPSGA